MRHQLLVSRGGCVRLLDLFTLRSRAGLLGGRHVGDCPVVMAADFVVDEVEREDFPKFRVVRAETLAIC